MPSQARRGPLLLVSLLLACLALLAAPRAALAWVDVHVEADDVKVTVEPSGQARVEHRITLKIAGGPLRVIDLRGVDRDAVPDPDGYVVPQREAQNNSLASAFPVTAEFIPPGNKPEADGSPALSSLRVRFQNERGLGRGVYVVLVRYATNLSGRIASDGAMARLTWKGPVWDDGIDSARVAFELPAAPSEPRLDEAAGHGTDAPAIPGAEPTPLVLSTVRRGIARDTIELVRPYAPRDEAVTWSIRADLRAFKATSPESARPSPTASAEDLFAGAQRALVIAGAALLFLVYSLLVARKAFDVEAASRAAGAAVRPLVPLPIYLRAFLAGVALTAGLAVQLALHRATLGALLVLAAVLLASHRPPRWQRGGRLRRPGRWLSIAEAEAFRDAPRPAGGWLDFSTRAGKLALFLTLAAVAGVVVLLDDISPYQADLVAFDAVALLAVWGTGRRDELPPDAATAPARLLRDVARRVHRALPGDGLRLVGRIRVPEGASDPDELRLAALPRAALAGFVSIEVGVVYAPGLGGSIGLPQVLLRVVAGSPCDRALAQLTRHGRSMRGRKATERVYAFSPRLPTARLTAGIVARLSRAVTAPTSSSEAEPISTRRAA